MPVLGASDSDRGFHEENFARRFAGRASIVLFGVRGESDGKLVDREIVRDATNRKRDDRSFGKYLDFAKDPSVFGFGRFEAVWAE